MTIRTRFAAVLASAALALTGFTAVGPAQAAQVGTATNTAAAAQLKLGMNSLTQNPTTAKARLPLLKVAADAPMTGYDRALFPHWRDASTWGWPVAPDNDCNARNAALYRDGKSVKMSSTCTNLTGTWTDPYSANIFNSASDIDIDHIVPLAEAWRSGASKWDTKKRTQFANDPLVLVSSWDRLNQSKGDKDPAAWVPPNTVSHCLYATRWVHVKGKYNLTLGSDEKSKLSAMLKTC